MRTRTQGLGSPVGQGGESLTSKVVKGKHGLAVETVGAELQKVGTSGPSFPRFFASLCCATADSHGLLTLSSCLTFPLDEEWSFVETEDWRPDIIGGWLPCGADDCEFFVLFAYDTHDKQAVGYTPTTPGSIRDLCRWKSGKPSRVV